ncbi:MAG: hypothetical protein K8E66_14185 [Phycisphaerales bacterium]|nr:hypothetical protein [Phycisphaerales bacterium]
MKTTLTALVLACLLAVSSHAGIDLPPLFCNHMVVQRDQPITIWGSADPGAAVRLTMGDSVTESQVDGNGEWIISLPPMPAGGPHEISITSGDDTVRLKDVLVGDVWICSGQSNMYWSLEQTDLAGEFVPSASNERLRLLQIKKVWSRTPDDTVVSIGWRVTSPETAGRFSAVGYHFGRILQEETGVPIGLIQSAWGGTPAEAWTPQHTLEARPDVYASRLKSLEQYDLDEAIGQQRLDEAQARHVAFAGLAWREDIGESSGWHEPGFDDGDWPSIELPGYIDGDLGGFNGVVWLRKEVTLDGGWDGRTAALRLGRIDDYDTTYVNGVRVGSTHVDAGDGRKIERLYRVPAGVLRAGKNVVAIALMDVRSSGGVTPDGKPFEIRASSGTVPLDGEWRYSIGFDAATHGGFPLPGDYAVPVGRVFRRPAALYNAMIHPLVRSGVKGVVWYQGESNSGRGDEYRDLFPDLINAWRDAWASARGARVDLPFYFVQLPNYRAAVAEPAESSWAEIREAQRLTAERLEDADMAITIDIGDPGDIHPTNKLPVAERLARLALHDLYGIVQDHRTGPLPLSANAVGTGVRVRFSNADGLHANGDQITGFALAGDDGAFHWVDATVEGKTVLVNCPAVSTPTRIRYGWADNPRCNLYNGGALPATPFELGVER